MAEVSPRSLIRWKFSLAILNKKCRVLFVEIERFLLQPKVLEILADAFVPIRGVQRKVPTKSGKKFFERNFCERKVARKGNKSFLQLFGREILFGRELLPLKLLLLAHYGPEKVLFTELAECGGVIVIKLLSNGKKQ